MIQRFRSKFFPVVAPEQLARDVERARFCEDLTELRRLFFRFLRFWVFTGGAAGSFSLAGFWPVLGFAIAAERRGAFANNRAAQLLAFVMIHGAAEVMALAHAGSPGFLEVSLSTWFANGDEELVDVLFNAAAETPGARSTPADIGRIWTARWLICSARSHSDFDAAIARREINAGIFLPLPAECSRLMPASVLAAISGVK